MSQNQNELRYAEICSRYARSWAPDLDGSTGRLRLRPEGRRSAGVHDHPRKVKPRPPLRAISSPGARARVAAFCQRISQRGDPVAILNRDIGQTLPGRYVCSRQS